MCGWMFVLCWLLLGGRCLVIVVNVVFCCRLCNVRCPSLFVACCVLLDAVSCALCLLGVVCSLAVVLVFVVRVLFAVVCCALFNVCCVLCADWCGWLRVVRWLLLAVCYMLMSCVCWMSFVDCSCVRCAVVCGLLCVRCWVMFVVCC